MERLNHVYHLAERLHLAYGFPLMIKEVTHYAWKSRRHPWIIKLWGYLWN